ncbi:MAG: hypothetical protein R6V53_01400 [Candidatus Woesearchaeota archaeon]
MKVSTFLLMSMMIIIIVPTVFYMGYQHYMILEIREIPLDLTVFDGVAMNTEQDALHMGGTTPGGAVRRKFRVENTHSVPVQASIEHEPFPFEIKMEPLNFMVEKGESKQVDVGIRIPRNASPGIYNTTVRVTIRRITGR